MKRIFFLLFLVSISAYAVETREFDGTGINKLEISNPKGEIFVSSNKNSKKIIVTIDKIEFDKKCKLIIVPEMGVLKVKVEHENALFDKANCVTKMKIEVPNTVFDSELSSGTANIKLANLDGRVDFKTASGTVEINGTVLKNIDGKTATGNVRLNYNSCPKRADINLATATGDAEIFLPGHCKIRVSHKSATGDLFNELGDSEDYQVLINSKSATGSLKVRKLVK